MTIVFNSILVELFWFCAGSWISLDITFREVHVVLVSLLADQLATFHLFGQPKKIGSSQRLDNFFYLLSWVFLSSLDIREWPIFKKDGKKNSKVWTKEIVWSLRRDNFLLFDQKKSEIDCAIGQPKRLTKTTWTPLKSCVVKILAT